MTKGEFRNLPDSGAMLEAIKMSKDMSNNPELWSILNRKVEEEEKAWQIEHFGHYDPDLLFDPLPKKREDN